jgi:hypothetical protein
VSKKLLEHIKEFFNKDEKDSNDKETSSSLLSPHSHYDISGKRKSFKRPKMVSQRNRTLKKKIYYL